MAVQTPLLIVFINRRRWKPVLKLANRFTAIASQQ